MTWHFLDRFGTWLRPKQAESHFSNPGEFDRQCAEDPHAAHALLMTEQRDLVKEFERTYAAYRERLDSLTENVATISPATMQREVGILHDAQDQLRIMVRRLDASLKTSQELERELQDWETRRHEEGPIRSDHPRVRAALIRSELETRRPTEKIAIPLHNSPFHSIELPVSETDSVSGAFVDAGEPGSPTTERTQLDPTYLLALIRMETREAERWHAIPEPDADAAERVRHVRELHGELKRIDREHGVRRDRIPFAIRMRDVSH